MSPEQLTGRTQSIIEKRYIKSVLQRSAQRIEASQKKALSNSAIRGSRLLQRRSITTPNLSIHMEHLIQQRFIDMKRLVGNKNKHQVPIHNTILMGEFNRIYNEIQFGFTEAIKEQITNDLRLSM